MAIPDGIQLAIFIVSLATMVISVLKMFFSFRAELEKHKTFVLVTLKEYDVKIKGFENDRAIHEADLEKIRTSFEKRMDTFHSENREDHSKVFAKMDLLSDMLTEVCTSFKNHTESTKKTK